MPETFKPSEGEPREERLKRELLPRIEAFDILKRDEVELLRYVLVNAPKGPPLMGPRERLRELKDKQRDLKESPAYKALIDGLEHVLRHLEDDKTDAARQRLELLLGIVTDYRKVLDAHNAACDALTKENTDAIITSLGLSKDAEALITYTITVGVPKVPPDSSPNALRKTYRALEARFQDILPLLGRALRGNLSDDEKADIRSRWLTYQKDVDAYEEACPEIGRKEFMEDIGLPPDIRSEEFQEFLDAVTAAIPPPSKARNSRYRTDAVFKEEYADLEAERKRLSDIIPKLMRHTYPREWRRTWAENIVVFMLRRDLYERRILSQASRTSDWLLYAGVVAEELGEEGIEGVVRFSDKPLYQRVAFLRELDAGTRAKVLSGWKELSSTLAARGVPMERMGGFFRFLNRTPMGPQFWRTLLEVESPVTVFLWGYYLYNSDNKVKASLQFGTFIALSNAAAKLTPYAEAALARMGLALKVPGPVKFAALLLALFAFSDEIDAFTSWVDKQIPDSPGKHGAGIALSLVSGDTLINLAGEGLEQLGVSTVEPDRDVMLYLNHENVWGDEEGALDRRFDHTIEMWNARVDQAVAALKTSKDFDNPVLRSLWELQKINNPSQWAERQSVFLFSQASILRQAEDELASQLISRGVIADRDALNASDIATKGEGETSGDTRNDRHLGYALGIGRGSPGLQKAREYIESLDEKDPLRKKWEEYINVAQDIAKSVSIFRHLGLYRRSQWLGDIAQLSGDKGIGKLPAHVEHGLIEDIVYRTERRRRTRADAYPELKSSRFASHLAAAIKIEESLPFMAALAKEVDTVKERYRREGLAHLLPSNITGYESRPMHQALFELMMAAEDAARIFPGKETHKAMEGVRALVLSGHVVSMEEIEQARNTFNQAVLDVKLEEAGVHPGQKDLRQRLNLTADTLLLVQGAYAGDGIDSRGQSFDDVRSAFGGRERSADLVLFQGNIGGIDTYRLFSFSCPGSDRRRWGVRIESVQFSTYYRKVTPVDYQTTHGYTRNPSSNLSFERWAKANPTIAEKVEPQLGDIEKKRKKAEEELERGRPERERQARAEEKKRKDTKEKALERAQRSTDAFVLVDGDEYQFRYKAPGIGTDLMIRIHVRIPSPAWESTDPGWRDPEVFFFTIVDTGVTWKVPDGLFRNMDQSKLSQYYKGLIQDVITMPIEGEDTKSLEKVLDRFYYERLRKGSTRYTLLSNLLPLYQRAKQKKFFLNELFTQIASEGELSSACVEKVSNWFKEHESLFQ